MKNIFLFAAFVMAVTSSPAHALVFSGAMDNRAGFPQIGGFTAQSSAWASGGGAGTGLRLEWQADDETNPGFWTYSYRLVRGSARSKGFAFFDIETAADFGAANLKLRQVLSATDRSGLSIPSGLGSIAVSDPVRFDARHDFSRASVSERDFGSVLSKSDLSHYSGDPGRSAPGQPGGSASATPSVGPVPHPFYGVRVTFPGSFSNLAYEASDWEFRLVTDRVPMWGSFFGWGDQTFIPPYWYANFYNDNIDNPQRLSLSPADSGTGDAPYAGWILVPGPLPAIAATRPLAGAVAVPPGEAVSASFVGMMDPASFSPGSLTLRGPGGEVRGTLSYQATTRSAVLVPGAPLFPGTTYTATLAAGVRDLAGNPLTAARTWSFTTAEQDLSAPTVLETSPADLASRVPLGTEVTATFSEALDPASVSTASFTLSGVIYAAAGSVDVAGTVRYNAAARCATFTPSSPLAGGALYSATVSGVRDLAGNPQDPPKSWSFTTLPDGRFTPGAPEATVGDALKALRIAVGLLVPSPDDLRHGDVAPLGPDGSPRPDGSIDVSDALAILKRGVGLLSW